MSTWERAPWHTAFNTWAETHGLDMATLRGAWKAAWEARDAEIAALTAELDRVRNYEMATLEMARVYDAEALAVERERVAVLTTALRRALGGLWEWKRDQEEYHPESVDGWALIEDVIAVLETSGVPPLALPTD